MHCTRLDIAYAMCKLSRFISKPSTMHWKTITRVIGYLKRIEDLRIFDQKFPVVLEGFLNASWITSATNVRSTSGWIFTLGGGAINWPSNKQTCVSLSTMKLKFIALTAVGKEAEWLKFYYWTWSCCHNQCYQSSWTAIAKLLCLDSRAYNNIYNDKSRHISLKHEFVR